MGALHVAEGISGAHPGAVALCPLRTAAATADERESYYNSIYVLVVWVCEVEGEKEKKKKIGACDKKVTFRGGREESFVFKRRHIFFKSCFQ